MLANCLFLKTVFSQFTHFFNYFYLNPFSFWTLKSWLEFGFFSGPPNNQNPNSSAWLAGTAIDTKLE